MTLRMLVGHVALALTPLAAQTPPGEIAGRMSAEQATVMPGVRVRIANGDQSSDAVTDGDGRFLFRSLTMGTYRVVAEIAGFKTASVRSRCRHPLPERSWHGRSSPDASS